MQHDWIENILAVIDTGSFVRAAEMRNITQSAFARRIDAIERHIGAPLFDRGRKPIVLLPQARALEPGLRRVLHAQRVLLQEARQSATGGGRSVTLACQHAITATVSPRLVRRFSEDGWEPVLIRSGNRDQCLLQLLSGEADLVVTYAIAGAPLEAATGFVERTIGADTLLPVGLPETGLDAAGQLSVIAYPSDVFFGELVERRLWSALSPDIVIRKRAETALTLAAYRYALDGIGVAWLPESLVADDLRTGRLTSVKAAGPSQALDIRLIRLADPMRAAASAAWETLKDPVQSSERLPDLAANGVEPIRRAEQRNRQRRDP